MKLFTRLFSIVLLIGILQTNSVCAQLGTIAAGFIGPDAKRDRIVERSTIHENINGLDVVALRVKETDIKSKAKSNIIALQNKLSEYYTLYKNNQLVNVPKKDDDFIAIVKKDEDWPTRYYIDELNAYIRFTIQQQQKLPVHPSSDSLHVPADSTKKDSSATL